MNGPLARDELAALIVGEEDSFTEFKDVRVSAASLAKELCAFVNAAGGRILIGVDDEKRLHDASDWDEERVMNVGRTAIDPPIIPTYQRLQWDAERVVVIVGVAAGAEKPYAVRSNESRRYYIRVGSTSREPSREELIRLTQASGAVASDLRPVLGATPEDLDEELLVKRFAGHRALDFGALKREQRLRILTDTEILHAETGGPTIGGLLCFGSKPSDRLPYATVSCVAYPGTSVTGELRDRADFDGRVDEQIMHGLAFLERTIPMVSNVRGALRVDRPRYSNERLREVIANAVAHRHYGIAGPIQLRVFADRIEVTSPGAPPNGVTPEAMRFGVSVRRNQFLMQRLTELGLVDAVGRGVVLLYDEAAELGLPEPHVAVQATWTTVTLHLV
ncbi:MAG TPA: ATP-binding protein [Solirubrobacteraceae bacterium]